jgi:phycocyanin-associated rod linker protein
MAKKMAFNQACKVAGQLYGSILQRNADEEGFNWSVDNLTNGNLSVREMVKELCKSEEFREKFMMNETPNELAKKLRKRLLGESNPQPDDVKETAVSFLENDWRYVIDDLVESHQYGAKFGEDGVPR